MYFAAVPVGVRSISYVAPALGADAMFFYLVAWRSWCASSSRCSKSQLGDDAELTTDYDGRTVFLSYATFRCVGGASWLLTNRYFLTPDATHKYGQLNPHGYLIYGLVAGIALT